MIKLRFSELRADNILGKSLRFPLSLLPNTTVISIMQGPVKGMKWIVGSGVHGMWLGSYEADKQQILADIPLEGTTVLDIGANVGFFSILLSRLVGSKGKVIAFEPLPRNLDFINRHIQLNKLENITVYAAAVGEKTGVMRFDSSPCHSQGRLAPSGDLEVSTITLDSISELNNPVSFVKIDVEGAEADVLRGGKSFFKSNRPIVLLATHGQKKADDCQKILIDYGYSLTIIGRDLYGSKCDEWLAKPNT